MRVHERPWEVEIRKETVERVDGVHWSPWEVEVMIETKTLSESPWESMGGGDYDRD